MSILSTHFALVRSSFTLITVFDVPALFGVTSELLTDATLHRPDGFSVHFSVVLIDLVGRFHAVFTDGFLLRFIHTRVPKILHHFLKVLVIVFLNILLFFYL